MEFVKVEPLTLPDLQAECDEVNNIAYIRWEAEGREIAVSPDEAPKLRDWLTKALGETPNERS